MALRAYTKEWLEQLCKESSSFAEVLRKAGRQPGGGAQATLKKKICEWDIDISHFTGQSWSKGKILEKGLRDKYKIEDIFIENSPYERKIARAYILRHNLIPYECALCGNQGNWLGQEISLELDHINGINNDHRINNLRWLCPNCHATTETFSGHNSKSEITIAEVKNAIDIIGPLSAKELLSYLGRSINGGTVNKIKLLALQLGYEI